MKMRLIKLDPHFLLDAIQGKAQTYVNNLPQNTELLDIKYDLFSQEIQAIIRSENFEDTQDASPIPEFNINCATSLKTATKPIQSSIPETKTVQKPQTTSTKETGGMEKEFSSEQRKLLSFKAEGENIVIKPIQYLKAEWSEINEVVKSINGQWVKEGSFGRWIVPLDQTRNKES